MPSVSHIVPVLVGDPVHCKLVSDMLLQDHGDLCAADQLSDRARAAPSACASRPTPFHTDGMMDDLVEALDGLWARCNIARLGGVAA